MRLADVLDCIRSLAPEWLAESWDAVGLHAGDPSATVRRALLCIDLTPPVLEEAVSGRADLVVAYHPPLFEPLRRLSEDNWKQAMLAEAIRRRIAIYSPHTALDAAPGGVNDWLAECLEGETQTVRPAGSGPGGACKLVSFVPPDFADQLRSRLAAAGAGRIGEYNDCSFNVEGQGTFKGNQGANPTVGRRGRLEHVDETRVEMICETSLLPRVVEALRRAHPYEEPAFDVVPLQTPPAPGLERAGQGRRVALAKPLTLADVTRRIGKHLGGTGLRVAAPRGARRIRTLGLCPGAGASILGDCGHVDAFLTGEMRHHDVLDAVQRRIAVLLAGHTQTERPYLRVYRRKLKRACAGRIEWRISRRDRAPLQGAPGPS